MLLQQGINEANRAWLLVADCKRAKKIVRIPSQRKVRPIKKTDALPCPTQTNMGSVGSQNRVKTLLWHAASEAYSPHGPPIFSMAMKS